MRWSENGVLSSVKLTLTDFATSLLGLATSEVLDARNMTFAVLGEHFKKTRYCEAFYDEQGRKPYGVHEPKKFVSIINRLVSLFGPPKLSDITVSDLHQYRRKRVSTKTNRGTYTDVATVNRELSKPGNA